MNKHNYLMALAMNADVGTLHLSNAEIPVKVVEVESEGGGYSSPMTTFKCLVVNDDQIKRLDRLKGYVNRKYGAPKPDYAQYAAMNAGRYFEIVDVIFNNPATIVFWADGTKTVVKCQERDTYSKETGLAMAIAKKVFGNKGNFNEVFKKFIPDYVKSEVADEVPEV